MRCSTYIYRYLHTTVRALIIDVLYDALTEYQNKYLDILTSLQLLT